MRRAVALLAGMGKGMLDTHRQMQLDAEREEDRQRTREMQELQLQRMRDEQANQIALRNAAKPATLNEQGALPDGLQYPSNEDADAAAAGQPNAPMPEVPRYRVETGNGVQRFNTREEAERAVARHNDPIALSQRLSGVLAGQGKVTEAMQFSDRAMQYAERAWQSKLGSAIAAGHEGLARLVSESEVGPFKGKRLKPVTSEDGTTVTYYMVGEDGTEKPTNLQFSNDQRGVVTAAFMLDRSTPAAVRYKTMLEDDRKRIDLERKEKEADAKVALSQARADTARTQAEVSLLRAEIARGKGGERVDSEDRKRWTTLHSEAGRQLTEARKRLAQLQGDVLFMSRARKEGTPEAAQLQQLQADIEDYKKDRELYGSLLGGKAASEAREKQATSQQPPKPPKPPKPQAAAPAAGGRSKVPMPANKAEYDALPPGTKYQHPNDPPGTYRTKR